MYRLVIVLIKFKLTPCVFSWLNRTGRAIESKADLKSINIVKSRLFWLSWWLIIEFKVNMCSSQEWLGLNPACSFGSLSCIVCQEISLLAKILEKILGIVINKVMGL